MKRALVGVCLAVMFSAGCASIQRGSAEEVTIRHGTSADYSTIQNKADRYCEKYGKTAYLRVTHSNNISIFDCK